MKIPQDARFRAEREQYALRFCCETCCGFEPDGADCAYGYPTEEHRRARYDDPDVLLIFCKDYDAV